MAKTKTAETPLMKQYNTIKKKYPDALLLFRVGDFYETFGTDAIKTSEILGIVLTKRANGAAAYIELAGFPHHSLETYLPKLVRAGQRVAICDQLEDPKMTKTIVKRGVTELITPGIAFNDKVLDHKSNNFLAALHFDKKSCGVSFLDVSTGEFLVAEGSYEYIDKLLQSFKPSEVIFQKNKNQTFFQHFNDKYYTYCLEDWVFTEQFSSETLLNHFNTISLKGFGIEDFKLANIAAGAALHYLSETQHKDVKHIAKIARIEEDKYVWLDKFTIRNLEIFGPNNYEGIGLINILDQTCSPMGSRMMKRWTALPLKNIKEITARQKVVEYFYHNEKAREHFRKLIGELGDIERIISKVAVGKIQPRELLQLQRALENIAVIKNFCSNIDQLEIQKIGEKLNACKIIADKILKEINPECPAIVTKGNVIADGINEELDELRSISNNSKEHLLKIQQREIETTGIPSLKIAFNNVFGYYIEVTNKYKGKTPENWTRKQTLVNAERFITEELKVYEEKILGAEDKILKLEVEIFNQLVYDVTGYIEPIQINSNLVAQLDCLISFAEIAINNRYTKPVLNDSFSIDIKYGRHPVIETKMGYDEEYIPNDVYLDNEKQQIIMITGPNMSGKSALLRQVALIVMMAQIGSFVPAQSAELGIVDKIFTRVGASDNISSGESTFMVEMNETASILNNISNRSLILLDEIGRGTSTYDGISIAWAIAEYLHEHPKNKAKTLFATHYHELNDMSSKFNRIKNFNVSIKEADGKILFLRKLVPGGSEHSFGINVAQMAGMPKEVITKAQEILSKLESSHSQNDNVVEKAKKVSKKAEKDDFQLSFFQLDDPVLSEVKNEILSTDINTLTPVEALMKLNEIKKLITGK